MARQKRGNPPQLSTRRHTKGTCRLWMGIGLAITFSLNIILLCHLNLTNTSKGLNAVSLHRRHPSKEKQDNECFDFGCPIYPAEITPFLDTLLEEIFVNKTRSSDFSFGTSTYALLTQRGQSHFVNQDRSVLISPFITSATKKDETSFLLGVFDGHGQEGHIVADHIARDFPERFAKELNSLHNLGDDQVIIRALNKTVVEVDINGPPNFLLGGSTATITLRLGSKLYIANTGDSQTSIVSVPDAASFARALTPEDATIVFSTRHDKAELPDEYARITALNGTIHLNPQNQDSRVVVYSVAARDTIALAMSRSLGDWEWKPIGVTAEPLINVIDLNQYPNAFLIAASDGVWGMRRDQFFAKQFSESFYVGDQPPLFKVWDVIRNITPKVQKGYRDDMTAIIMKL